MTPNLDILCVRMRCKMTRVACSFMASVGRPECEGCDNPDRGPCGGDFKGGKVGRESVRVSSPVDTKSGNKEPKTTPAKKEGRATGKVAPQQIKKHGESERRLTTDPTGQGKHGKEDARKGLHLPLVDYPASLKSRPVHASKIKQPIIIIESGWVKASVKAANRRELMAKAREQRWPGKLQTRRGWRRVNE